MTSLLCALPLLVAGCDLGDPSASSAVVLDFPASKHLSAADPEIQEALRIIDKAFASNDFGRLKYPPAPEDQAAGIVVDYGPHDVSIAGHSLRVNFNEFTLSRSSPTVRRICSVLKETLSERFGSQRVKVELDTQ
jgi:hypothetical protein